VCAAPGDKTIIDSEVTIPANSPNGYRLGPVKQGDTLTLQYVKGLWKAWGHVATEDPDGRRSERGNESRLVLAGPAQSGRPGPLIAIVPHGTVEKPFTYVFPSDRDEVVLRIHSNSDIQHNPGKVTYKVKLTR
jgi:hypothetical protein